MKKIFITITSRNHYLGYGYSGGKWNWCRGRNRTTTMTRKPSGQRSRGSGRWDTWPTAPTHCAGGHLRRRTDLRQNREKAHAKVVLVTERGVVARVKKEK